MVRKEAQEGLLIRPIPGRTVSNKVGIANLTIAQIMKNYGDWKRNGTTFITILVKEGHFIYNGNAYHVGKSISLYAEDFELVPEGDEDYDLF